MLNVAMATLRGLHDLKDISEIAAMRGKNPEEIAPFWTRSRKSEAE
jgi:ribosomal protein S5